MDVDLVLRRLREVLGEPTAFVPLHEPRIDGHAREYVLSCLDSGWVSTAGAFVDRFERELAAYLGAKHVVAAVNGTAALHLALLVAGVRPGDHVLVPTLTFVATANAVHACGAMPHFVDVTERTLGVDPQALDAYLDGVAERRDAGAFDRASGRRIAACVPMHTFGHPVEMDELVAVCTRWGIPIVEDAAESLGSTLHGRHAGTFGWLGIVSFNGNKVLTTGGGGAIITDDPAVARRAKHLSTTAKLPHPYRFDHDESAFNYRMPNLNAALGVAQLERLDAAVEEKRRLAHAYQDAFRDVEGVSVFVEPKGARSNYWLNALLLDAPDEALRDALLDRTNGAGIMTRPAWTPMHRLPMYVDAPRMPTPVSDGLVARIVNIPSSPALAAQADAWRDAARAARSR
jgi:perosamine synthetase